MATGLAVSDVVEVDVTISPIAIPARNFGALCVLGPSAVVDTATRVRQYSTLDQVATEFGTTTPEYLAANLFFSQNPQPSILYIGRWAKTATAGQLNGQQFSPAQQTALLATLQAITTGGMTVTVDGTPHTLSALDFSAILNLNGAATVLDTAVTAYADVSFDATFGRFVMTSKTTGTSSTVAAATDPGSGAALATALGWTSGAGAVAVPGIAGETPIAAVQATLPINADIYGIMFADGAGQAGSITDAQYVAVAAYVEGLGTPHVFGITNMEAAALDPTQTTQLASLLKNGAYTRTFSQYSSSSPYAVASMFARAFTVDFTAQNTVITLKFKQEPGVTAETLNETQAATLKTKNTNVFVNYQNGAAIIQDGVMASGMFFDERHGTDWLQNAVQNGVWNLLYQSPTKIPQTDSGVHQLVTAVEHALDGGVFNGLIGPGIWNSSLEFGKLTTGMTLSKGYYTFAPQIALQTQSDREARKAPTIQCAIKLTGAVHSANVAINVNR